MAKTAKSSQRRGARSVLIREEGNYEQLATVPAGCCSGGWSTAAGPGLAPAAAIVVVGGPLAGVAHGEVRRGRIPIASSALVYSRRIACQPNRRSAGRQGANLAMLLPKSCCREPGHECGQGKTRSASKPRIHPMMAWASASSLHRHVATSLHGHAGPQHQVRAVVVPPVCRPSGRRSASPCSNPVG